MGGNQHSSTDVAALRCRSCLLEGVRHMTRRARTCCVVIRTGGARRWSVCIPKESKVVVVVFFVVLFDHWPNTNTYGSPASLGRPHWAGKLVRTSLPRSHSPALHGSLPSAWRKDALIEAAGGWGAGVGAWTAWWTSWRVRRAAVRAGT